MKTKILLLLVIATIYTSKADGQTKQGIIVYEKKMNSSNDINDKRNNALLQSITSSINKSLKDLEFKLYFNSNESSFKVVNRLSQNKMEEAAIMVGDGSGVYYLNIDSKEKLHQKEAFGKSFIIKDDLYNVKWVLKNKSKNISQYKCNKATTTKTVINEKGKFVKKVTAWYTPKIPANFGPIGYGNLPGLILELDIENEVNFIVKKIELNTKKKIIINKPAKGKLVTPKEFEEISKKSDPWVRN